MLKFTTIFFLLTALACNDSKSDDKGKAGASTAPKTPNTANSTGTADSGKGLKFYFLGDNGTCTDLVAPAGKTLANVKADAETEVVAGSCPANTQVSGQAATIVKKCDAQPLVVKGANYSIQTVIYSKQKEEDGKVTDMNEARAVDFCKALAAETSVADEGPKSTQFYTHGGDGLCIELVYGTAVSEKAVLSTASAERPVAKGSCPATLQIGSEAGIVFKKCGVKKDAVDDYTSQTVIYNKYKSFDGTIIVVDEEIANNFCS